MRATISRDGPDALYAEAKALVARGAYAEASRRLDVAIARKPDFAPAFALGGFVLEQGGKPEAAVRFYARALDLDASQPAVGANLAKLMIRQGRFLEALQTTERALARRPRDADLLNTQSGALRSLGRMDDAADAARAALALKPDFPEAAVNLGTALLKSGEPEAARRAYAEAVRLRPGFAGAICGGALALRALNRLDEARAAFDHAAALGCVEAVGGRGCLDLMLGRFAEGWDGYESRWVDGKSVAEALGKRYPSWIGPEAPPQRVLVLNDHGLGDTIQFCRYLPLMIRAGAEPHLLCPSKLHRLIGPLIKGCIFEREPTDVRFDAQIAISSLPRAFSTRLDSVPAAIPYLAAEPERVARWAERIGGGGFRVGCVWQGNANPEADVGRAFSLASLAPLAVVPDVRLISLQRGPGEEQLWKDPPPFAVERLSADYDVGAHAFLDAAAAMMSLDLVVTCDTSIAHLAGALGRPTFVALKFDAEWRWMRERDDTPWYPSLRLFRQPVADDWAPVFAAMADALASQISRKR